MKSGWARGDCSAVYHLSVMLLLVGANVQSSTGQLNNISDKTYSICSRRCAPPTSAADKQAYQSCMLRCRNYIEEAMFRPRILFPNLDSMESTGQRRYARAAKGHTFVRVGKSSDTEADDDVTKRSEPMPIRGSFVRIGRPEPSTDDNQLTTDDVDVTKRRGSGFVRIGRRGPWSYDQQFVRIGRGDFNDADNNDELADDQSADKRARGQAFVRIGRKPANFVRIGRAFVRIGKSGYDAASATDELVDNNALSSDENADHHEITEE